MNTSPETEPRPEAGAELARLVLAELLAEVDDSWNGHGLRLKLKEKLRQLDGRPDDTQLHF
jgi:hypothetical protein